MRLTLIASMLVVLIVSCDSGETVEPPLPMEPERVLLHVAGTPGQAGNGGDGGPAVACSLFQPVDVTVMETGEILVVDWRNNRVRRVSTDGIISSFIGSGTAGDGVAGTGPTVDLNQPTRIEIGPMNAYYVAGWYNWRIKVFDAFNLECSVLAGTGSRGFTGDSGLATLARLDLPSAVVFDALANMYVLDQGNTRVRKVDAQTGMISTFVGGMRGSADGVGEVAQFSLPGSRSILPDPTSMSISPNSEDIYLADSENHTIRRINLATRMVTTIAGIHVPGWEGDGGPALLATLNYPTDLDVANNGDIYVADTHNHVIRKISSSGVITTVAGNGSPGVSPSGTRAVETMLYSPFGVEFDDATNTLYIADTYNHRVIKVINP